jgi:hypothetical protein
MQPTTAAREPGRMNDPNQPVLTVTRLMTKQGLLF